MEASPIFIQVLVSLAGVLATVISSIVAYRKVMIDAKAQSRGDARQDRTTEVDAASKVTDSAIKVNAELSNQLDDCYKQLDDQAALKTRLAEYRVGIRQTIRKSHEMLEDMQKNEPDSAHHCSTHQEMLLEIVTDLEKLYSNGSTKKE